MDDFDRQPPQDIHAEQCVLGSMLLSKDAIAEVVEQLRDTDFYRPQHQVIYQRLLDLYAAGEPVDPVTAVDALTKTGELVKVGGAPYLFTLTEQVPVAANAGYYARIVSERAILRRLVEAATKIAQIGYGSAAGTGLEVDEAVNRAQQAIYEITERRGGEDYQQLEEVLPGAMDELESIGNRGGALSGIPSGFSDLDSFTNGWHPGQLIIVAARPSVGKALALDTPLPTPTGWTTMGAVQVGDRLLAATGQPTTVVAATEVLHGRPCYEVEFSDGTVIVADAEHQWFTETRASRRSAQQARTGYNRYKNQRTFPQVRTTEQIAATLRCGTGDGRLNHTITNTRSLALPERELPIPPYVLGVWLGDGHTHAARFTSADPEIAVRIEALGLAATFQGNMLYSLRLPAPEPVAVKSCVVCGRCFTPQTSQVRTCGRTCGSSKAHRDLGPAPAPACPRCAGPSAGTRLCRGCRRQHGSVHAELRTLGVLGNKHIPVAYLRASENQRRELLAGLLDTDGTVTSNGCVQFSVVNRQLAENARELIVSLGYRCGFTTKRVQGRTEDSSTAYTLTFTTPDDVFHLERKHLLHKERRGTTGVRRAGCRTIMDIRPIPSVPVRCIQVDNPDHLYLASRAMIPTHNSTMALDFARACSVRHGMASVIFSLEMSKLELTMRLLSAEARVPLHAMRSGTMNDDDWARVARRMGEVAAVPLFLDDSPNMNMMEIRAKARRLKQQHDLRMIVIDYLQLMTPGKRLDSRQQEVSELSRGLKLLAKELEVPVIVASQLNRNPEQRSDKRPQLSDLRESGAIEMDADAVLLLFREDMYEKESTRAGEADIILAKHRNGPTGTVTVAFQGHFSRFVDMARP